MSHVSEGALHAYLDGALNELPSDDARAIREHVEACPVCATRLEEEKQVREEAIAILSGALPRVEVPPLEELRLRAAATSERTALRGGRLNRLGWAASVVLAIGTGWMLRGGPSVPFDRVDLLDGPTPPRVLEALPIEREAPAQDAPELQPLGRALDPIDRDADLVAFAQPGGTTADAVESPAEAPASSERLRSDLAETDAVAFDARAAQFRSAGLRAGLEETAALDAVALRDRLEAVPTPPVLEASELLAPSSSALVSGRIEPVVSASDAVALREVTVDFADERAEGEARERNVVASARRSEAGAAFRSSYSADRQRERQNAGQRSGWDTSGSLVVRGFETIAIETLDEGPVAGGVRALQLLMPGDTLELLHLPEGVEPADLAPVGDEGVAEIVVSRDGLWLVARARRSVRELEVLLERLDGKR